MKSLAYGLILAAFLMVPGFFYKNYLIISLALALYLFGEFLWDLGRKIKPLDVMAVYGTIAYLCAPALSYYLVETDWYAGYSFMSVESDQYFDVAFPGTLSLLIGIYFPFNSTQVDHKEYLNRVIHHLADKTEIGKRLFWFGCACSILHPFMPKALVFFILLGSYMIYIGGLYIWYSNDKYKVGYLIAMFIVPLIKTVRSGMFTELVFWSMFLVMILLLKYRVSIFAKLGVGILGLTFLLMIQSVKQEYRTITWYDTDSSGGIQEQTNAMGELVGNRIDDPELLFGKLMFCAALDRTNQGLLTSMAIRYTPDYEPFAKGETIFLAALASFIPRAVWPSKPIVGGRENMIRFTGFEPLENTSMDIGPLGDAYVNFGAMGGALFLFCFALFFNFIYAKLFHLAKTFSPTMLLWIPMFFTGSVSPEGSVLSALSNIIKVAMFCAIIYWAFKRMFKTQL